MFKEEGIGVDVGHGYVKAVNEKGDGILFPSVISNRVPLLFGKIEGFGELVDQEVDSLNLKNLRVRYHLDGGERDFFIGMKALLSDSNTELLLSDDKFQEGEELIKALVAISLLTDTKVVTVDVGIGLPVSKYDKYKEGLKEMFQGSHHITLMDMGSGTYAEKQITISGLLILQQSLATLYDYVLHDDGSIEKGRMKELKGKVGIIDLGTRTTDVVLVEDNILNETYSYTIDEGIAEVLRAVSNRIQDELHLPVIKSSAQVEKILVQQQGIYCYQGKDYNLNPIFREEMFRVAEQILKSIKTEWKDHFNELSCTLLGGGGSEIFKEYFKERIYNIKEMKDPQFANARGYLKTIKARSRKSTLEQVAT